MKQEVIDKLSPKNNNDNIVDTDYWQTVLQHLNVYIAKAQLNDMHSKMLVHQLEILEKRREEELALMKSSKKDSNKDDNTYALDKELDTQEKQQQQQQLPQGITNPNFGNH